MLQNCAIRIARLSITLRWTQSHEFSIKLKRNHCFCRNIYIARNAKQAGKLKFFGTLPNWVVSYIAYTKFHSPSPVFHSPNQIFTRIGEQASASFPACKIIFCPYHACWCLGYLHHQAINRRVNDHEKARFLHLLCVNFNYLRHFIAGRYDIKSYSHISCKKNQQVKS